MLWNTKFYKTLIKEFNLPIQGKNSYLSVKNFTNYITIFFNNDENKVYEYYIYYPNCSNNSFTIINSLNENRNEEDIIRIKKFFLVKSNKYYMKFENTPDEIGHFLLNNTKINSDIGKIPIESDNLILDFIVNDKILAYNKIVTIKYRVIV